MEIKVQYAEAQWLTGRASSFTFILDVGSIRTAAANQFFFFCSLLSFFFTSICFGAHLMPCLISHSAQLHGSAAVNTSGSQLHP